MRVKCLVILLALSALSAPAQPSSPGGQPVGVPPIFGPGIQPASTNDQAAEISDHYSSDKPSYTEVNHQYLMAEDYFFRMKMVRELAVVQNSLAENFIALNDYQNASVYAARAAETALRGDLPDVAVIALANLIAIHEKKGDFKEALKFHRQYELMRETLQAREREDQISRIQLFYADRLKREQASVPGIGQTRERNLRYVLIGTIISLILLGALFYRLQVIRSRKGKMILASKEAMLTEQLKNTLHHEQQLQSEIEAKNKELASYALNFIQKNHLLEELKERIALAKKQAGVNASPELGRVLYLISHSFNLDKDWQDFRIYFEQVHHRFFQKLQARFQDLSNKELRLCALLKLNLSSKEMATILGISADSVKMARYRMRKKLHLSSQTDLTAYLINFEKQVS